MSLASRLSLFYAVFFLSNGLLVPFWPVWLAARGLSPAELGVVFAFGQWVGIATMPVIGGLADRSGDPRRTMLVLAVLAVAGFTLCFWAHDIAALILLNALAGVSLGALIPVGDSIAVTATEQGRADFGRVRVWGTITFIVATVLGGLVLNGHAPDMLLALVIPLAALNVGSCWLLPRGATHLGTDGFMGSRAWRLMLTRRHLVFLAAVTLISASHSVYYAFASLHWQEQGFSKSTIGWLWAEGAAAEAVFLFWGAKMVKHYGPARLMALGAACGAVRWTVLGLSGDLRLVIPAQLLHAGTVGAVMLGSMHYLGRTIPAAQAATGQAVTNAVVSAIGASVFMPAVGALYAAYGGFTYLIMAALSAMAVAAALMLERLPAIAPPKLDASPP